MSELKIAPPTRWLARGWIPFAGITVLVGEEGIGKSLAWVRWVAHVTTGAADDTIGMPARPPRDVVVIVTEDNPVEVLARLHAAGADTSRVHTLCSEEDGTGNPVFSSTFGGNMATLDAYLEQGDVDVALVVVDAWVDTVDSKLTLKDGQQARQAMGPWKILAEKHSLAVVLVTHTNRLNTGSTRDLMGSTAVLRQKARMVLFAARSPEDRDNNGESVWIGPEKSNTTGRVNAVKYKLDIQQARPETDDDPGTTARLSNPEDAGATVGSLMSQWQRQSQAPMHKPSRRENLETALTTYVVSAGGSVPSAGLKTHLRKQGFGKTAIEDAMSSLGNSQLNKLGGTWTYALNTSGECLAGASAVAAPQECNKTRNTGQTVIAESSVAASIPRLPSIPDLPTTSEDGSWSAGHAGSAGLPKAGDRCTSCRDGAITQDSATRGITQCLDCIKRGTV